MEFINFNGRLLPREKAVIRPDDRSYRYGDGLFETMKLVNRVIALADLHFDRLYNSLQILKFKTPRSFNRKYLVNQIGNLCTKNQCEKLARVRLSVSRGYGAIYDAHEEFQYVLECWPLQIATMSINKKGLVIGYFPDARKSCDIFSNLKSASHLPYVMAARFGEENKLDDCLVLNSRGKICDTTIANVFWVRNGKIFTPPLSEGCIAGVMRSHLMETLRSSTITVRETKCDIKDLVQADEIFLTNAVQGIRWVRQFENKIYKKDISAKVYQLLFSQER